jgi:hypothetical protein
MSNLYWPTETQMERLRPYFPKSRGRARVDDRRVLSPASSDLNAKISTVSSSAFSTKL